MGRGHVYTPVKVRRRLGRGLALVAAVVGLLASTGVVISAPSLATTTVEPITGTIDWNDVRQTMDGFGASGAFGQAGVVMGLPEPARQQVLDALFSTTTGAGLSMVRNLLPNIEPFPGFYRFDRDQDQIWLMQQAKLAAPDVRFMSTVWSPPPWMKTNNMEAGGGSVWPQYYSSFAEYLARYSLEYKSRFGLDIYAISPANEPDAATSYASSQWTGQQLRDFTRNNVAPIWKQLGVTSKYVIPESSYWGEDLAAASLDDPGLPPYLPSARDRVDIVAAHGYGRDSNPLPFPKANANGKTVWQSEYSRLGFTSDDPSIDNGILWAKRTHDFLTGPQVSLFNQWWLTTGVGDTENTQEGLIAIKDDGSYTVNKRLWTMGNWSRFVRPGWKRVNAGGGDTPVTAFRDPISGKFAAVAINPTSAPQTVALRLNGFASSSVIPYTTSATDDLAAGAPIDTSGGVINATLPANSVTTFAGQGATTSPLAVGVSDARLYTGESATVTVTVHNDGVTPVEVELNMAAGGGVGFEPASSTLTLAPGATSTVPVTASAARGGATGTFPLQAAATVVGTSGPSVVGLGSARVYDSFISFYPNTNAERPWLFDAGNSQLNGKVGDGHARFTDGTASAVYRFDLPADLRSGTIKLELGNQFLVQTSTDRVTWTTRLQETRQIRDLSNRATRFIDLNTVRAGGSTVFVRLADSFPSDGWGGWLARTRVEMVRPVLVGAVASSPNPSLEGSTANASAPIYQGVAPFTCTVDHGDGTGPQAGTVAGRTCTGPAHTYVDNGSFTITVVASDAGGSTSQATTLQQVTNVAPTVEPPVVTSDASGKRVSASASFTDPGAADGPFSCTVDYGDLTGPQAGAISGSTCSGPTHHYKVKSTYTVTVTVTDKDGGAGSALVSYTVR